MTRSAQTTEGRAGQRAPQSRGLRTVDAGRGQLDVAGLDPRLRGHLLQCGQRHPATLLATGPSGLLRLLQFGGVLQETADLPVAIAAGWVSAEGVVVVGHRDLWRADGRNQ